MSLEHLQRFAESLREDERREVEAAPAASSTGKAKRKRKTVQEVVDYLNEKSKLEFCGEVIAELTRRADSLRESNHEAALAYWNASELVAEHLSDPQQDAYLRDIAAIEKLEDANREYAQALRQLTTTRRIHIAVLSIASIALVALCVWMELRR